MKPQKLAIIILVLFFAHGLWASGGGVTELMTSLVLQVGIVLFAARIGGMAMKKLKMPSVLGELLIGILIGPFLLGGIAIPGFPHGLFPLEHGLGIPVSTEIYAFSTVASIILLFVSGLETDLSLFLAFSVKGAIIGISGVVFSFFAGAFAGSLMMGTPLLSPANLFLGILSIATSVGITARILSEQRKMDSPEGVTILAAAVIDDVLGIILLAMVLGVISVLASGGEEGVHWAVIGGIAAKALGVWLGFTVLGLILARRIGNFLKMFGGSTTIAVLSLGLALLMAGLFEKAGLAMIIGAYVMGLSLSRTDISFMLQEKLHPLMEFFVPIFFCVMGMLVNVEVFFLPGVLVFGLVYTVVSIIAKILGCGIPSLFLNFNTIGALRIGVGMVPRGEVALIIAGIGLAGGILDDRLFGVAVLMTLITTLSPPPVLTALLKSKRRGTRKEMKGDSRVDTSYDFPSFEMVEFALGKILGSFEAEDFYVHEWDVGHRAFQIRKDEVFLTLNVFQDKLEFVSHQEDVPYIRTLVYETLLTVQNTVDSLKNMAKPEELRQEMAQQDSQGGRVKDNIFKELKYSNILMNLEAENKDQLILEMLGVLSMEEAMIDKDLCYRAVWDRENTMSTGMQNGIAIPHGKTDGVKSMIYAIGIKKQGMDFEALDGKDCNIFIMVLSPLNTAGPHIQFLSSISAILKDEESRQSLLNCHTPNEVKDLLLQRSKQG
ncbi:MAG: cation:proton antiporter [Spirochaetaceae bacterium]|nr:cation:proton antiporter [Spirochaetaceae bacterium]